MLKVIIIIFAIGVTHSTQDYYYVPDGLPEDAEGTVYFVDQQTMDCKHHQTYRSIWIENERSMLTL